GAVCRARVRLRAHPLRATTECDRRYRCPWSRKHPSQSSEPARPLGVGVVSCCSPVLKIISRVDVTVLPCGAPAHLPTAHRQGRHVILQIGLARNLAERFGGELRQSGGGPVLILSTCSPKNSRVSTA